MTAETGVHFRLSRYGRRRNAHTKVARAVNTPATADNSIGA